MSYHHHLIIVIIFVLTLTSIWTLPTSIKNKFLPLKNGTSLGIRHRISSQTSKLSNITTSVRERWKPSSEEQQHINEEEYYEHEQNLPSNKDHQTASVVVLTSLSGIYVWWPLWFGGDNSFYLLLTQDDVPRFHDVTSDEQGHIYLTAPHERTVYRLQYADGWWISNFSNHSVMNSIRSEMPLFVTIHHVSSILYVYGHSDIQIIDLLERPRARGSAPFMKRLRELSPNLRISDMVIDQLTSDGYIVGDSYGWCTIIRCSLSVNECEFLFKIPSSYDNRPYPCTATIDFAKKLIYLSLEEKILAVYLNEQTNYDRRYILTEKHGSRSTLGYDDIFTFNNTILYTDVLRPLLHICTEKDSNPCLNISLTLEPSQRTILPLRFSVVQAPHFRPPVYDDEEDESEIPDSNQSESVLPAPLTLNGSSNTRTSNETSSTKPNVYRASSASNIWMLLLGVCIGLILAGISFTIYYVTFNKNRPQIKKPLSTSLVSPSTTKNVPNLRPLIVRNQPRKNGTTRKSEPIQPLIPSSAESTASSSETTTTTTTSSSSYHPDTIV